MHDADAGAIGVGRGSRAIGLAVEHDLAFVGGIDAGEQIDERRLAGAVLAEQHMPFAAPDRERNAAQRDHAGEAFADRFHAQNRVVHRAPCSQAAPLHRAGARSPPLCGGGLAAGVGASPPP